MVVRVVRRGNITFTATAFCRAKWGVHWLPESGSSGRVGSTSHVNVTLATAAVGSASIVANEVLVVAVQGTRELSAGLASSGRSWGRADRTWCHRTPADTPTRSSLIHLISNEQKLDNVAFACYVGRQGGSDDG